MLFVIFLRKSLIDQTKLNFILVILLFLGSLKSKIIEEVTTMNKIFKHVACRNAIYAKTVQRFNVPDELIPWSSNFDDYKPPTFESPVLQGKPWADRSIKDSEFHPKFNEVDGNVNRVSWTGRYEISDKLPLNPFGRTGEFSASISEKSVNFKQFFKESKAEEFWVATDRITPLIQLFRCGNAM